MSTDALATRADIWLWHARFVKTRALAVEVIERGRVRLTRSGQQTRLDKPSRAVRPGDVLTIALPHRVVVVRIEALPERRGPAEEAQGLYTLL
ncbi:RNA-binding S4 domain-containing protein [Ancylobacter amanitiformis]|uniref:Ribosome-associated heat shock protein Hsp15 n=1 Tax=Ancylobacter amanitiformis TaxID=217069 RepID=A0ABU0LPR6_9HYPH|nr:RNA-binding S4 domain-containing protein [Ancylobacter amanitiformis]MDQ0510701.1 ribosome-associated heat shock protein Hsp15 [Ancylobacter amanitiformis]